MVMYYVDYFEMAPVEIQMDARDPFAAIGGRFFYFDGLLKEIKVCPLVLEGWIDLRQLRTTKERLSCRLLSERVRDSDIRLLMRNWMERIKNFDIQFVKQIYPRNENAWFVKVNRAWSYFYLINAGSAPRQRRRRLHEEAGLLHGRPREKLALTFHHCLFKSVHFNECLTVSTVRPLQLIGLTRQRHVTIFNRCVNSN